jgi:hypothetical protein
MEEKKVKVRIEHQDIGDGYSLDFLIVTILINNNFNPDLSVRCDPPLAFNEDRKTFKLYPFVHN